MTSAKVRPRARQAVRKSEETSKRKSRLVAPQALAAAGPGRRRGLDLPAKGDRVCTKMIKSDYFFPRQAAASRGKPFLYKNDKIAPAASRGKPRQAAIQKKRDRKSKKQKIKANKNIKKKKTNNYWIPAAH